MFRAHDGTLLLAAQPKDNICNIWSSASGTVRGPWHCYSNATNRGFNNPSLAQASDPKSLALFYHAPKYYGSAVYGASAAGPRGPWVSHTISNDSKRMEYGKDQLFVHPCEDPFAWFDVKAQRFRMVVHSFRMGLLCGAGTTVPCGTSPNGSNGSSVDLLTGCSAAGCSPLGGFASSGGASPFDGWRFHEDSAAFDWRVPVVGGGSELFRRRERPSLLFDEDGKVFLYTSVSPAGGKRQMYTHGVEVLTPDGVGGPVPLKSDDTEWTGTRPFVVGTGDGGELAQFPASLSRFGTSDNLLLIAAGNPDMFMPRGGFGREWASYTDGASFVEVGPKHPTDGNPRKGVACVPTGDERLTCIPFRLQVDTSVPGNRSGVAVAHVWQAGSASGPPTRMVGTVNVSVVLNGPGGTDGPQYPSHWGFVPDMVTPIAMEKEWLLTMYGDRNPQRNEDKAGPPQYDLVALTSPRSDGKKWRQKALIKNNTGLDNTTSGPCSAPSENDMVQLPGGALAVFYRNQAGPSHGYSTNIPLCVQLSRSGGEHWSPPCQLSAAGGSSGVPHGVEPKVLVVGQWLVVISGRNGLFAHYTNLSNVASLSACKPAPWRAFNIAELHNRYYAGTPQAFSNATVAGTGGGDETTGYMGAILTSDARGIVICYDRTVSHAEEIVESMMHYNTIYCFTLRTPS